MAGQSKRSAKPETTIPATTTVVKTAVRGQGGEAKGKANLNQDVTDNALLKQADSIILQAQEQASDIAAEKLATMTSEVRFLLP